MVFTINSKRGTVGDIFIKTLYEQGTLGQEIFNTLKNNAPEYVQNTIFTHGQTPTAKELTPLREKTLDELKYQQTLYTSLLPSIEQLDGIIKNTEEGMFSQQYSTTIQELIEKVNNKIIGLNVNINTVNETNGLIDIYTKRENIVYKIRANNTFSNRNPYQHVRRPLPEMLLHQKKKKQQKKGFHQSMEDRSAEEIIACMDTLGFTNSDLFRNKIEKAQKRVRKDLYQHISLAINTQEELGKNVFDSYAPTSFKEIHQLHSGLFVGKPSYSDGAYRLIFNPETREIVDICPHKRYERKYLSKKKK